jgi:hypothetical protein
MNDPVDSFPPSGDKNSDREDTETAERKYRRILKVAVRNILQQVRQM